MQRITKKMKRKEEKSSISPLEGSKKALMQKR